MRSASGIFEGHGWDLKNGIFFTTTKKYLISTRVENHGGQ